MAVYLIVPELKFHEMSIFFLLSFSVINLDSGDRYSEFEKDHGSRKR